MHNTLSWTGTVSLSTVFFAQHATPIVLAIAAGQACIALGMLAKGRLFRLGAVCAMIFLLSIAPLGIGSAFPCTLVMAAGMWLLFKKGSAQWLWHTFKQDAASPNQYTNDVNDEITQ